MAGEFTPKTTSSSAINEKLARQEKEKKGEVPESTFHFHVVEKNVNVVLSGAVGDKADAVDLRDPELLHSRRDRAAVAKHRDLSMRSSQGGRCRAQSHVH